MTTDRPNTKLADAVDHAVQILESQGMREAAAFLVENGAGFALTCRVLAEPARRRARPVDLPPASS